MPEIRSNIKTAPLTKRPAYTVKQVSAMSGVSVRTLHFYDESRLLKPAYHGANGYRYYEEPQLLILQQILFYRELGIELKRIKKILGRRRFAKIEALQTHRKVLQAGLARTRRLIATIDQTVAHLKGTRKMKTEEMFAGFTVAAGGARFGEHVQLAGQPADCKVSAKDTNGTMAVFETTFGWPYHIHHDLDEWLYVIEGEIDFVMGKKHFRAAAGQSVFIPRRTAHGFAPVRTATMIDVFQPAGSMEDFFRAVSALENLPTREDVINKTYTDRQIESLCKTFAAHGMDLLPPPDVSSRNPCRAIAVAKANKHMGSQVKRSIACHSSAQWDEARGPMALTRTGRPGRATLFVSTLTL